MHAIDITRHHFQPAKHYSGLLHYQGSVLLDSEQNEEAFIQQGEGRRVLTDLLVTSGSPDDGMKIAGNANTLVNYDFDIDAGVFYLGGLRLDVERTETFKLQSEFLQHRELLPAPLPNDWLTDPQSAFPAAPPPPNIARTDLVWLEAYEQAVTGTEDSETIEMALQVESSARLRPMRKIHLFPNAANDCSSAFDSLLASLLDGRFTFDPSKAELKSNRRLFVDFLDMGPDPGPCEPKKRRGFLGAENEAIQIRIIAADKFVWSFGNAAPLYRQTLNADIVTFAAPPRDELMRPLVGDLIEIIRCDALLPNLELIGERHGLFFRVKKAYDPDTRSVQVEPLPNFPNDVANADALAAAWGFTDKPDQHLFARVWRGESMPNANGKDVDPAPGVELGDTGVMVSFTGQGPVGDSWTFSVRPNTPEVIVPWVMRKGAPPTAPRRYITGLGLIKWDDGDRTTMPKFIDCRRHIRKLEDATGCCEVTVGDGTESFGDVSTIDEALSRLPASGGKICLLRGSHFANVLIQNRKNITIEGCGPLTRLRPKLNSGGIPVIAIGDCAGISIRNFAIYAPEEIAIAIDDSGQEDFGDFTQNIDIRGMQIFFRDAPAIIFNGGEGLKIEQCITLFDRLRGQPQGQGSNAGLASSVILLGRDMLVERCRIDRIFNEGRAQLPVGGIQIVGGSERVEIRRNRIARGGGIGIVLGSVSYIPAGSNARPTRLEPPIKIPWKDYGKPDDNGELTGIGIIIGYIISDDGCFQIPVGPEPPVEGTPPVIVADPLIIDCRIIENDIEGMGNSGIAPFMQFDLTRDRQLCGVSDLIIRCNRIMGCALGEAAPLQAGQFIYAGRGGIILGWAENAELVGNQIEHCGATHFDPICGIFAVGLAHARISENRIDDNGRRLVEAQAQLQFGQRGGIVIRYVQPAVPGFGMSKPSQGLNEINTDSFVRRQRGGGGEALLLHENQVSTPEGRALEINGVGAMSINDNQLASLGATSASFLWLLLTQGAANGQSIAGFSEMFALDPFPAIMGNAVVSVLNFGLSSDNPLIGSAAGLGDIMVIDDGEVTTGVRTVTTGRLMFEGNQTRYDGTAAPRTLVPCLVGLASLDDAKMVGNQCEAEFGSGLGDFASTHALLIAVSLQMSDNRFSEPDVQLRSLKQLSGLCFGFSVFMHHNFGTHCFLGIPLVSNWSVLLPNKSIATDCEKRAGPSLNAFGDTLNGRYAYAENIRSPQSAVDERSAYMRSFTHA